jgi:hypothetical protein
MGYFMRFIATSREAIELSQIEAGLKRLDPAYSFKDTSGSVPGADFLYSGEVYGEIEINRSGDGLFDEEIEELREFVADGSGKGKKRVLAALDGATHIIAVRLLFGGRDDSESVLEKFDRLWEWLFESVGGLLQADGEGIYDNRGNIIVEFD